MNELAIVALWVFGTITYMVFGAFVVLCAIRIMNAHGDSMIEDPVLIGVTGFIWPAVLLTLAVAGFAWLAGRAASWLLRTADRRAHADG